jgi:two-component system, OmpR family, KDP operon response regulator KdpE
MSNNVPLLLLIEDEARVRYFLRVTLTHNGYRLVEATTAQEGLVQVATHPPDLVLLDLGLPDLDGLEVTRRLREWTAVPIIILSAREQEEDKVLALDAGADDYLTKPFGVSELLARIRVALRHTTDLTQAAAAPVFQVGDLRVDLAKRQVFVAATEVHLTPIEYKLLTMLVRHAGKVVTQPQLFKEVWGPDCTPKNHNLRVHMAQLRHKLEADPTRPRYLVTEPGVGYRLKGQLP